MNIYVNNDTDIDLDGYYDNVLDACKVSLLSENADITAEISITFVDDDVIREMNHSYRDIDEVTDVLSFPSGYDPKGTLYGDIFICYNQAIRQAAEIGNTPEREIMFLTVHGTLHLLGYDHLDDTSEKTMIEKQKEIMKNLP